MGKDGYDGWEGGELRRRGDQVGSGGEKFDKDVITKEVGDTCGIIGETGVDFERAAKGTHWKIGFRWRIAINLDVKRQSVLLG